MGAVEPVLPLTVPSLLAPHTLRAVRVLSHPALLAGSLRALLASLLPALTSAIKTSRSSLEAVEEVEEVILTTPCFHQTTSLAGPRSRVSREETVVAAGPSSSALREEENLSEEGGVTSLD